MEKIKVVLELINAICKIAFITYAWMTMLRVNAYIKEKESKDKK